MGTPHKHAAVIKAWADGAEIEYRNPDAIHSAWFTTKHPVWVDGFEYRVKPDKKQEVSSALAQVFYECGYEATYPKDAPKQYKGPWFNAFYSELERIFQK